MEIKDMKMSAVERFRLAIERKRIVEDQMRSGRPLSELEAQGFRFWRVPANC